MGMRDERTLPDKPAANDRDRWLVNAMSKRLFAYSARMGVALLILGLVANLTPDNEVQLLLSNLAAKVLLFAFVVPSVLAALWLWIGMGWYWLRLDSSSRQKKALWFLALLLLNWVGAIAYYFVVYRRSGTDPSDVTRTLNTLPLLLSSLFFVMIPLLYLYPQLATNRFLAITLFIVGLFIVLPTVVILFVKVCRYGLRIATQKGEARR